MCSENKWRMRWDNVCHAHLTRLPGGNMHHGSCQLGARERDAGMHVLSSLECVFWSVPFKGIEFVPSHVKCFVQYIWNVLFLFSQAFFFHNCILIINCRGDSLDIIEEKDSYSWRVAQQFRALGTLAEEPRSVPKPTCGLEAPRLRFRGSDPL